MREETNQRIGAIWYYKPGSNNRRRKCINNHSKKLLYEILHRGVTTHDQRDINFLVKILPKSTVIDSYAMLRYIMILINSVDTQAINKNFIMYLETSLTKFDLSKPDVFVEFLTYFIKHNRIQDARELYTARHKYMSYQTHRFVIYNDVNIACHGLLMNYIDWYRRVAVREKPEFDVSIQGWLVNGMDPLKQVEHNYEFFIMCIVNVLLYYGLNKKAYLLASEFQRANPDNISGQLLLRNLIKRFTALKDAGERRVATNHDDQMEVDDQDLAMEEHRSAESSAINNFSSHNDSEVFNIENYPIANDNRDILRNLIRLDPRRHEILELSEKYQDKIETIQVIMDSLMEVPTMRDIARWRNLKDLIDEIISSGDSDLINGMSTLWRTKYQPYWRLDDILRLARESSASSMRTSHSNVIKRVIRALKYNFDCDTTVDTEDDEFEDENLHPNF